MFLDFFLLLRQNGLPVTMREFLSLLEALQKDVGTYSVENFYYLSRTVLIKHEQHLDRFDMLFGSFFGGLEMLPDEVIAQIPEEWLRLAMERHLSEEEKAMIESMGGLEQLMERLRQLLQEQRERHEGGNKWIGTGGICPYGANGYFPEGIRIGQAESRHRRAVKVWDQREFRNLDDDVELNTRNLKMALKRLRALTREGLPTELDLDNTIRKTCNNAGLLDIEMVPSKQNRVKVLMFFDVGGSMDDYVGLCEQLFSAAKHEFKHLEYYYFHNCIYESVWKDNRRRTDRIPTLEVLNTYNKDYKVIIVGDASMAHYELTSRGGSVEHNNDEPGMTWLERIKAQYPYLVWLNPTDEKYWDYTYTIKMLREFSENRMFPLTLSGLTAAMRALKDKKIRHELPEGLVK